MESSQTCIQGTLLKTWPAFQRLLTSDTGAQTPPCFSDSPLRGSAGGTTGSYCESFPASAYYTTAFRNIWQFSMTLDGQSTRAAYCLEKGLPGPTGSGHRYEGVPVEVAFPNLTQRQTYQLAWILQHTYPVISSSALFSQAGVNPNTVPVLDANDAYAASQIALWSVFSPTDEVGWILYQCGTNDVHPKNARLLQVIDYLWTQSLAAATAFESPLPCDATDCISATIDNLACFMNCGEQAMSPRAGGGWLYGPMRVYARVPFTLSLSACCGHEAPTPDAIQLVDEAGTVIASPPNGTPFYVAFPQNVQANCYQVTLSVSHPGVCAYVMRDLNMPPHENRLQSLGLYLMETSLVETINTCFCCYAPAACPPCETCPECPACPSCPPCKTCPKDPCLPLEPMPPHHPPDCRLSCPLDIPCREVRPEKERRHGALDLCRPFRR